jgi:hypothetical protein
MDGSRVAARSEPIQEDGGDESSTAGEAEWYLLSVKVRCSS